ncbi:MAG: hypothetical protein HY903_19840 [Deltaproteobacteria bacterium]|nr:hypothetical protein [Deltaproteobacteria bacterium]
MSKNNRQSITKTALAVGLFLQTACGAGSVQVDSPSAIGAAGAATPQSADLLVTRLATTHAAAGQTLRAFCLVQRGSDYFEPSAAVTVSVLPSPAGLVQNGSGATISATTAGSYQVACALADGSARDPNGAVLEVAPGPAVDLEVSYEHKPCYSAVDRLQLDVVVRDGHGNEIAPPAFEVTASPAAGVSGNATDGFRFSADGDYQLTVRYTGPQGGVSPMTIPVHVDATPPVVVITDPARDATVIAGSTDDAVLMVKGYVADTTSAVTSVHVGDLALSIRASTERQTFTVPFTSRWGLSVVTARATDACGNAGWVAHPFHRSPTVAAPATSAATAAAITEAMHAQVSQPFLDDHNRADLNDLASVAQAALSTFDPNQTMPRGFLLVDSPARACDGCPTGSTFVDLGLQVARDPDNAASIVFGAPRIDRLQLVAGGVEFALHLGRADLPLRIQARLEECTLGCSASQTATLHGWAGIGSLDVSGRIMVDVASGAVNASVNGLAFETVGAYVDLDCGILDSVCDQITSRVVASAVSSIQSQATQMVSEQLSPLVKSALASAGITQSISLPAPAFATVSINVQPSRLSLCGQNVGLGVPAACTNHPATPAFFDLALATKVFPSRRGASIPTNAAGALVYGGGSTTFDAATTSFGLGVRYDFVNSLFWAMWYAGGLEIPDLKAALGAAAGLDGSLAVGLAPVIMPGTNGSLFDIGIGDIKLDAQADLAALQGIPSAAGQPIDISLSASLVVGVELGVDDATGTLRMTVTDTSRIYFQVDSVGDRAYAAVLGKALSDLLARELPKFLDQIISQVQLPAFNLKDVLGLQADVTWYLQDADIAQQNGAVTVSGSIAVK